MACRARFTRDPSSLPLAPRVLRPRQEATPYFAAKELAGFQHIGRHRVHVQSLELWERPRQTHQGDDGFAVRLDFEGALARLLLVDLDGCNTLQRRLDLGSTGFEGASGLAGLNGYDGLACFGGAFRGRGGLGRGLRLLSNRLLRCHFFAFSEVRFSFRWFRFWQVVPASCRHVPFWHDVPNTGFVRHPGAQVRIPIRRLSAKTRLSSLPVCCLQTVNSSAYKNSNLTQK